MRSSFNHLLIAALAVAADAEHVLHEARTLMRGPWRATERVHADAIVPLRIGLKQHNLEEGAKRLHEISSPTSKSYGQYMTQDEVHDFFAPAPESVSAVMDWLLASGINRTHIAHSDNKGWIAANVPAGEVEALFKSELYEYEHATSDKLKLGCESYHLPAHLVEHVDYVTPGIKLSATLKKRDLTKRDAPLERRAPKGPQAHPDGFANWSPPTPSSPSGGNSWWPSWGTPPSGGSWSPWGQPPAPSASIPADVADCSYNITPPCWRYLYKLPVGSINDSVNDLGLFEQGDYFAQSDISSYFATYDPRIPPSTAPVVDGIDGGVAPQPADNTTLVTGESDIDIDITISLVYPQTVVVYQVDDIPYAVAEVAKDNLFNTFLDALDGSYCNYTAYGITGDSPGIDPTYPDTTNPGGYTGQLQCGVYKPTRVISASYGESEYDLPKKYVERQCNEFMKLGLQGTTMMVSSSDYGVGQAPGDPDAQGCLSGEGQNNTIYAPDYPSGCPYILSVGATMLEPGQSVDQPETAMQISLYSPGRSPDLKFFASSGGFSNYFTPARYQQPTIDEYFLFHNPNEPYYIANEDASNIGENGGVYNRAGRGYPDVAANGAFLPVFVNGELGQYFGTSLASPIWASTITLINQQRTLAGKGPVGFINPVLYANQWALNDITNGSNPNCGGPGFTAVRGWDPVTGLGTPNYPKLLDVFLRLP